MKAYRLVGGFSLLTLTMVITGCGKGEPGQAGDKQERAAIEGAKATPKREAVAANKLQNRAGVIYVVNGQEPFSGSAQDFYSSGQMKWEIEIEAGKVVVLKRWHANGVLELSCGFTAGTLADVDTQAYDLLFKGHERLDGDFESFFDSGQKFMTANFKQGQATGELTGWRKNGNLWIQAKYEAGKVVALKRWHENGVLELSCGFTTGTLADVDTQASDLLFKDHERLDGDYASFFDSGQKYMTANFKQGQAAGELTGWRKNGNLWIEAKYENGNLTQLENYDDNGQLVGKAGFSGAKFDMALYLISALLNSPHEKQNGEYILYHPNGQMSVQRAFENGKIVGEERNWAPNGTEIKTRLVASIGMRMSRVAPGTFSMGSPASEAGMNNSEIQHSVTISREYWLGRHEVTQGEWVTMMGSNPSYFKGSPQLPVEKVSWNDAMEFCQKVTQAERQAGRLPEGYEYTLPTEAQWEYACRAGSTGAYGGDLNAMAWYFKNSYNKTHSVGQKQMNAWGFYDMHGNVWELCRDKYSDYPSDSVVDPEGASQNSHRLGRGGSWGSVASSCRSASRVGFFPDDRCSDLGFRLCLAPVRL